MKKTGTYCEIISLPQTSNELVTSAVVLIRCEFVLFQGKMFVAFVTIATIIQRKSKLAWYHVELILTNK